MSNQEAEREALEKLRSISLSASQTWQAAAAMLPAAKIALLADQARRAQYEAISTAAAESARLQREMIDRALAQSLRVNREVMSDLTSVFRSRTQLLAQQAATASENITETWRQTVERITGPQQAFMDARYESEAQWKAVLDRVQRSAVDLEPVKEALAGAIRRLSQQVEEAAAPLREIPDVWLDPALRSHVEHAAEDVRAAAIEIGPVSEEVQAQFLLRFWASLMALSNEQPMLLSWILVLSLHWSSYYIPALNTDQFRDTLMVIMGAMASVNLLSPPPTRRP